MNKISERVIIFLGVELRNQDSVSKTKNTTLGSALDSWRQAPRDVREGWADTKITCGISTELSKLIKKYGRRKELIQLVNGPY